MKGQLQNRERRLPLHLRLKVMLVFALVLALGAILIDQGERNLVLQRQKAAMSVASTHAHLLQEQLNRSLSATYALAAVLRQGDGRVDNFDALAGEMLGLYGGISALQLAPKGVIRRIAPAAGNAAALGHDLLQDPERNKEAFVALATRKLTVAGPFVLRQGGVAVVGRLPVYLPDEAGGEAFWGFATAVVKIADLLRASRLDAVNADYDFELSRVHPDSGRRDVFAASSATPLPDPVSYALEVPNGTWTLSVVPAGGWHSSVALLGAGALVVLAVALLVAMLTAKVFRRSAELAAANAALREERAQQQALIDKLEEAHNQLLQAEKMASIGQLAAGVAHEINNPIGFVNSNLSTLQQYSDDLLAVMDSYEAGLDPLLADYPQARAVIAAAKEKADLGYLREDLPSLLRETQDGLVRVRKIVQDLREFSHVDESEWQFADLNQGLESTLNLVRNELKYKAEIVRDYGELPPVECIPSQLNQVFMNLVINAGQAIAERGTISIRSGMAGEQAWIEVEDTGEGIPEEQQGRIFEPFYTTRPVGEGTGLGLSLAYGIVRKHGGLIEVRSTVGAGSIFRICLPVTRAAAADAGN